MSPATNPGPGFDLSSSPSYSRPTELKSRPNSPSFSLNSFILGRRRRHQQLHHHQVFDISVDVPPQGGSKYFDEDGRLKRTGTVWTSSAHIITAVIGSGVLSLAWATTQLGWVAGPSVMLLFSFVTYYTSTLLSACYRSGDSVTGKKNYTYMDAVRSNLGGAKVKICGYVQYLNLFGVSIGYTIASSISMMAIKRSNCFHKSGEKNPCHINSNPYMIAFGVTEIIFSQIPDFDQLWWLSIVAAVMYFTYSTIGIGLGIAQVAENGKVMGSMTGISIGTVTATEKMWKSFQALGDIAFAYSYSLILIEIQDTIRSPAMQHQRPLTRLHRKPRLADEPRFVNEFPIRSDSGKHWWIEECDADRAVRKSPIWRIA
ncbi:hypothetical protein EV1_014354 [Malus domestica]